MPSAAGLSAAVLARCPLTVIDLGQTGDIGTGACLRPRPPARRDRGRTCPAGTLLLVTSPGAAVAPGSGGRPAGPPHLMTVVVSGPGYADGLLTSAVHPAAGDRDAHRPDADGGGLARPRGARRNRRRAGSAGPRAGDLAATIASADRPGHRRAGLAGHPRLVLRRLRGGRRAGVRPARPALLGRRGRSAAGAAPGAGEWPACSPPPSRSAPTWRTWSPGGSCAHPAWWLYGMAVGLDAVGGGAALAGPWRRDPLGPFGAICLATLAVLAVDVMTGSRLQLEAPFGLSLLVCGRYYGIGNDALGVYCVSALVGGGVAGPRAAACQRGCRRCRCSPAGGVGLFAVVASGWPGFGAKVGGTIALVPCLLLLLACAGRGPGGLAVGGAGRGQRRRPVPRVRPGQLLLPGGGRVRHGDVRREPAARPGR